MNASEQLGKAARQLDEAEHQVREAERLRRDAEAEWAGGQLPLGVMLVAIGCVFTAERLGYIRLEEIWRLWPLFFVAIAVSKMISRAEGALRSAFAMFFMAGIFLMHNLDVLPLADSWPLFIVLAGVMTLWKALARPSAPSMEKRS